jgi:hypothetical protein
VYLALSRGLRKRLLEKKVGDLDFKLQETDKNLGQEIHKIKEKATDEKN